MKLEESLHKIKQNWNDISSVKMYTPSQDTTNICYKYTKMIGRGTFGIVILVEDIFTNKKYALKRVYQDSRYYNRELDIFKNIQHKNIVKLHYYYYEEESSKGKYLNLLMEYFPYSMEILIKDQKKNNNKFEDTKRIKSWCKQLLSALEYIHNKRICHRDIKPANILLDSTMDRVVICDMGSAKKIEDGGKNIPYVCSRYYRSPENIFGIETYDCKIDVWSLGCVMIEIHSGEILFKGSSNKEMINKILKIVKCSKADLLEMGCEDKEIQGIGIREYIKDFVNDKVLVKLYEEMIIFNPEKRSSAKKLSQILATM